MQIQTYHTNFERKKKKYEGTANKRPTVFFSTVLPFAKKKRKMIVVKDGTTIALQEEPAIFNEVWFFFSR